MDRLRSSESECVAADKPSIEQFCQGACPSTKTCEELGTNFSVRDALLQASRIWENNPDGGGYDQHYGGFPLPRAADQIFDCPEPNAGRASRTTLWRLGAIRRLAPQGVSVVTVIIPKTELLNIMITWTSLNSKLRLESTLRATQGVSHGVNKDLCESRGDSVVHSIRSRPWFTTSLFCAILPNFVSLGRRPNAMRTIPLVFLLQNPSFAVAGMYKHWNKLTSAMEQMGGNAKHCVSAYTG